MYHKWRAWGGPHFGSYPKWNSLSGKYDPIEPFPGACGDCGKPKIDHISEWTHQQKLDTLAELADEARRCVDQIENITDHLKKELR